MLIVLLHGRKSTSEYNWSRRTRDAERSAPLPTRGARRRPRRRSSHRNPRTRTATGDRRGTAAGDGARGCRRHRSRGSRRWNRVTRTATCRRRPRVTAAGSGVLPCLGSNPILLLSLTVSCPPNAHRLKSRDPSKHHTTRATSNSNLSSPPISLPRPHADTSVPKYTIPMSTLPPVPSASIL